MANEKSISNQEAISEEIAEYYSHTTEDNSENNKQGFKFNFNIEDKLTEEIYDFNNREPYENLLFCSACVLSAAIFLCTAFILGINTSADNEHIDLFLDNLRKTDLAYTEAQSQRSELEAEVNELALEALEAQERIATLGDFEATKQSLSKKLADKKSEFQKKNDELYSLNQALKNIDSSSMTVSLTPGVYTVGTNLPEGIYDVSGNGSIIAATSVNESIINSALNTASPVQLTLKSGYIIKINCTAKFTFVNAIQ